MRADKTARNETDADPEKIAAADQKGGRRVKFLTDDGLDDDAEEPPHSRSKNGYGIAGRIISALILSANSLAGAANQTWTDAVRYNRVDFAKQNAVRQTVNLPARSSLKVAGLTDTRTGTDST